MEVVSGVFKTGSECDTSSTNCLREQEDDERRLHEALARIVAPMPRAELLAECLKAVSLLEQLDPEGCADRRIELAWHVVNAFLYEARHGDMCARALLLAFPARAFVRDRFWERRWLTALAVTERIRGNIVQALKAEAAALSLAEDIGDGVGQVAALAHLAAHSLLSARFDEALQLSDLAIQRASSCLSLHALANAHVNKGNTLLYLGRYEESLSEAQQALLAVGPVALMPEKRRVVLAKALAAESLIALGRTREAVVVVASVESWAGEDGAGPLSHEARRVRALLDIATGETSRGFSALRDLRSELDVKVPSLLMDLLQTEYRARAMVGDRGGALEVLQELRSYFVGQAEQTLKGLQETPSLMRYMQKDGRLTDLDKYLESKRLLSGVVWPANDGWEYLVALAASSIAPEDPSLEHGVRVGRLAAFVASALGLDSGFQEAVFAAGLVHDVGKVGIPPELLLMRGPLSEAELAMYDAHSETGAQLLEHADFPNKRIVINAARYHHCAFAGGQRSISGDELPLEARIIAVCDAFDGLVTGRPRRSAVPVYRATENIYLRSGTEFDPRIVDALVVVTRELPTDSSQLVEFLSADADDMPYFECRRALRRGTATKEASREGL